MEKRIQSATSMSFTMAFVEIDARLVVVWCSALSDYNPRLLFIIPHRTTRFFPFPGGTVARGCGRFKGGFADKPTLFTSGTFHARKSKRPSQPQSRLDSTDRSPPLDGFSPTLHVMATALPIIFITRPTLHDLTGEAFSNDVWEASYRIDDHRELGIRVRPVNRNRQTSKYSTSSMFAAPSNHLTGQSVLPISAADHSLPLLAAPWLAFLIEQVLDIFHVCRSVQSLDWSIRPPSLCLSVWSGVEGFLAGVADFCGVS
ncbi:hypothetical protein E2P81_ATG01406 [Venturia nashicola]|nr:hypothetical protein E2P81_ATG01406 [Venturia nashicola]